MKPWNIIGWIIIFFLAYSAYTMDFIANDPKPINYEQQANCIAEFDYQHPNATMMDNLVVSLRKCKP